MGRAFVVLTPLPLDASVVWVTQTIEGKIMSVNLSRKMVTLCDGTTLTIPADVEVHRDALEVGVTVEVTYEEEGGQNVVTSIQVLPEKRS